MKTELGSKLRGESVSSGRMASVLIRMNGTVGRYADDGLKCPGHPEWQPHQPRRELRALECRANPLGWYVFGQKFEKQIVDVVINCKVA